MWGGTDLGACVGTGEECSDGGACESRGLPVGAADGGDYGLDGVFLAEAGVGVSWCLGVWWGRGYTERGRQLSRQRQRERVWDAWLEKEKGGFII